MLYAARARNNVWERRRADRRGTTAYDSLPQANGPGHCAALQDLLRADPGWAQ